MNRFILASFLLVAIFAVSEAALAQQKAKEGSKLEIDAFKGAKGIKRTVAAGEQLFHFEGDLKGSFVDLKGKKVEPSNYEAKNGVLVIKKFTKADVGIYSEYPPKATVDVTKKGDVSSLAGLSLDISLE